MTLDEAVALLKDQINAYTGTLHTTADLKDLLDQGLQEVAALTLSYEKTITFTDADSPDAFELGCREYLINGTVGQLGLGITDHLKTLNIHNNGVALVMINPNQYSEVDARAAGGGTPHYWYEHAGYLGFLPWPNAAFLADYSVEITYAASPVTWTSGESILMPAYDELITGYAYIKSVMSEGRWQEAATAFMPWFSQIQAQPIVLARPLTQRRELPLASTEQRRLKRRSA